MLHGYGEHSGRYMKFPERMPGLSAQLAIMDFRGMGKSDGVRGDVHAFEDYLRDVTVFVDHLRKKHGVPRKFILLGHSLGGLVAVLWSMKNQDPIKMLILSGPFLGLTRSWLLGPLNRLVLMVAPRLIFRDPVQSRDLSHDLREIDMYCKDPLILRTISAHLVGVFFRQLRMLRKQPILSVSFPVQLLLAGEEHIVDSNATRLFFQRLVTPRKEKFIFDGFFHEIFNERDQQKAFNVLKTIIEDCV
jgi:alpha-beta hydrolase superfamily lysophospholipase